MRQGKTQAHKANLGRLLAYSQQANYYLFTLHMPETGILKAVRYAFYIANRLELSLVLEPVKIISGRFIRSYAVNNPYRVVYDFSQETQETTVLPNFVLVDSYKDLTLVIHSKADILHISTPQYHFVFDNYRYILYQYEHMPDMSMLKDLRNIDIWKETLEDLGI